MAADTAKPKRITDIGPPHYEKFLPPVVRKNYGQWEYHETLAPGVLCHVAASGDSGMLLVTTTSAISDFSSRSTA